MKVALKVTSFAKIQQRHYEFTGNLDNIKTNDKDNIA